MEFDYLNLLHQTGRRLFPNALWGVLGAGHGNFKMATMGLATGAHTVRVGFEDGLYLPDGRVAERNHQLIEKVAEIANLFGRRPATPEEARRIMRLDRT